MTGYINQKEVPVAGVVPERENLVTDEDCITGSDHVGCSTVVQMVPAVIISLGSTESRLSKCTASIFGKKNKLLSETLEYIFAQKEFINSI